MKRVTGNSSLTATTLNGDTAISDTTLNGDTSISVTTLTADFDSQFEAPAAPVNNGFDYTLDFGFN